MYIATLSIYFFLQYNLLCIIFNVTQEDLLILLFSGSKDSPSYEMSTDNWYYITILHIMF